MSKPNTKVLLRIAVGVIAVIGLALIAQDELNDPYVRRAIKALEANNDVINEHGQQGPSTER